MASSLQMWRFADALPPKVVTIPYTVFLICSVGVSYFMANMSISVLLTLGGFAQCLAITILWAGSFSSTGPIGISPQYLLLNAVSLCLRLSSSLYLNGYLPVDATGDWLYQAVDVVTLVASVLLLFRVSMAQLKPSKVAATRSELDNLFTIAGWAPMLFGVPLAFIVASFVHANMNSRPLYDILWTAGHFLSSAASMPQLRSSKRGSSADETHIHYSMMATALGQLSVLVYMWLCRPDVTCDVWIEGFSHAVWFILAAPAAHLAIVCDVVPQIFSVETF